MSNSSSGSLYDIYAANEFSADAFSSLSVDKQSANGSRRGGRLGLGIGGNYFFNRYFGVGADAYSENVSGPFIDSMSASAIGRFPINDTPFAPYAFAGLGHQFDLVQQTFGQIGAGLEYRMTEHMGFFGDIRVVIPDKTDSYGLFRAGFRWRF
ncbi:MAG TPA: outer membrane beta-barrel protein [Candidatus Acidoferrales bacterium]|nr:outer membrane beta-barrel protein [Candidatus Acidoferrales bacterium]